MFNYGLHRFYSLDYNYESGHKVILRAHEHTNPPDRRYDEKTNGKPEPKRFATASGNQTTRYSLQDVKEYHENDDPSFFVHIIIQLVLFIFFDYEL